MNKKVLPLLLALAVLCLPKAVFSGDPAKPPETPKTSGAVVTARGPEPVVRIFGTAWCGYCKKARDYFAGRKVPFVEHDIEKDPDAYAIFRKLNPQGSVPVVLVGSYLIRGYSEEAYGKALEMVETRGGK